MQTEIREKKFDAWRHGLLDISRRNKLMNYRKSRRATLQIIDPSLKELYRRIVIDGDSLSFRKQIDAGDDLQITQLFYIMDKMGASVELAEGEIRSDLSAAEMNQTLRNLRAKAKLSQEEQGINILCLSFGFLKWRQKPSDPYMLSPLVLVPVSLEIESILSPYMMKRLEEDIVINPTLDYALSSEYGITLPEFDPLSDDLEAYLNRVNTAVTNNGWSVVSESNLGLLSFLKIVMYKDLEKNRERIFSNPVVQAFCGDVSALPRIDERYHNFLHDSIPLMDVCQVVNADASQQDAILLSRNGVSFVLQGPPGTGKSQTITNIIAQALADKKKVLFVSEKMAALSVVYRRLEEVGLQDYCLSLHNYRAERRAVIQDLVNTLDAPTRSVKAGVTDALAELEAERKILNSYVSEMNRIREPLNRTIYEVVTELTLTDNRDFYRISGDTGTVSEKEFAVRMSLLQLFSDFVAHCDGNIYENPWRGTTVRMLTYDVRETVLNRLGNLSEYLFGLAGSLSFLEQKYGIHPTWNLDSFEQLLRQTAGMLLLAGINRTLKLPQKPDIFTEDSLEQLRGLRKRFTDAQSTAAAQLDTSLLTDEAALRDARTELTQMRARLECSSGLIRAVSKAVFIPIPDNTAGLQQGKALLLTMNIRRPVLSVWFKGEGLARTKKSTARWRTLADKVKEIRGQIDTDWESGFYKLDDRTLVERFTNEYTSFFKVFNSQYRNDRNAILSVRKGHPAKLDDRECLAGLRLLRDYWEALAVFEDATENASSLLGPYFRGMDTDWVVIDQILARCDAVSSYMEQYGHSDVLLMHLEKSFTERMNRILPSLGASSIEGVIGAFEHQIAVSGGNRSLFAEQIHRVDRQMASLDNYSAVFKESIRSVAPYMVQEMPQPETADQLLAVLDALLAIIRKGCELRQSAGANLPEGKESQRQELLCEAAELFKKYICPEEMASRIQMLADCYKHFDADAFSSGLDDLQDCVTAPEQMDTFITFDGWFPDAELKKMPLQDLSGFVSRCRDIESLQSFIRYSEIEQECREHDLLEYLQYAEKAQIRPDDLVALYRKSFLTKWLMDILYTEHLPYLQNFQSYGHEKIISRFAAGDRNQLQIARARLTDRLSHEKPAGMSFLAGAMDEVTILRREAEKKRRIIPLRRLFKTIPALLQKLKPCFMMSPLSVSYFLDSEMYSFDMVIFDEASQILPEDAIGAIYRGKQVIIAGDTRQMPPTNFFTAAAKNTDDYDKYNDVMDDDSDEYYPDIISESILDEASACLPSCTLLWHYRSRDESLIAFSNRQLYNNNLITFPNCSRLPDRGLEYIYVPNGIYEGSGKNCNVMEARKCLQLVTEHIRNYPDRSLGIVAFSEKQQAVIEEVISDYRLQNPQVESFFDETRDEPFFVKNLENVQGDERDTIIISICYAKNSQGRMYQRFGPLGHDGGERRLNVAITRAKYNVKLVGSILPTDIAVKEGTKDGVRMLREYIYYAMQNDYGYPEDNGVHPDEPFVDWLAACIKDMGYACRRDVGSSAYKVDIAVEKPGEPDTLMAGIECDGYNYINTRTARDRDVTRRSMMSSLGWRIYHAWSMAWYLNPEKEKKRLQDFLSQCDGTAGSTESLQQTQNTADSAQGVFESADDMTDIVDKHTLTFPVYEYADPTDVPHEYDEDPYTVLARGIRWVLEREQPMHKEEFYRRMAPYFGCQKADTSIRREINDCMSQQMADIIDIRGKFIYLVGMPVTARAPKPGEAPRPVDHIAPEELRDAMIRILTFAYGLTAKELISETARQLGYARAGSKITAVLEDVQRRMLESGDIRESDGKLYCVEEDV